MSVGSIAGDHGPVSAVDCYLADLDASLRGPRRRKRDLLREAGDHLTDATEAYEGAGLARDDAERRAVLDFGDTSAVAPAYQAILSVDRSRRVGIALFLVVLAQPFAWGLRNSAVSDPTASPLAASLDGYVEISGVAALVFATVAVVASGIGVRFVGVRESVLRFALVSALVSSVLIAAISIAMFSVSGSLAPTALGFVSLVVWIPMTVIAVSSLAALRAVDAATNHGRPAPH